MRLIDADALIKDAMKSPNYFIIKYAVQKAPTIDAEPVVRCKDCRDREVCITSDDWYCADAERSRR